MKENTNGRTKKEIKEEIEKNKISSSDQQIPIEVKKKKRVSTSEKFEENTEEKKGRRVSIVNIILVVLCIFVIAALIMSGIAIATFKNSDSQLASIKEELKKVADNSTAINDLRTSLKKANEELQKKEDKFIPPVIPNGFTPDKGLIDVRNEVKFLEIPKNLEPYKTFFNVAGIWGKARAGYYYDYNDAFLDVDRLGNVQIPTFGWVTFVGEEMYLPGIGSLKDPNGGAVEACIINVWEKPGELERAYLRHGAFMVGRMFNMSDMTIDSNSKLVYGGYTLESLAILRNHSLYNLTTVDQNGFNFIGQTGSKDNAKNVTWIAVIRDYEGKYNLVGSGQYVKEQ